MSSDPIRASYSTLTSLAQCPAKLMFRELAYQNIIQPEPSIKAEAGSAAHHAFEQRMKGSEKSPYELADEYLQENLLDKFPSEKIKPSKLQEARKSMQQCIRVFEDKYLPALFPTLRDPEHQVELKIQVPYRGTLFTGKVDLITNENNYVDYKTGELPASREQEVKNLLTTGPQAYTYRWLAGLAGMVKPSNFIFLYLQGLPTNYREVPYKSGPRKGQLHPEVVKEDPKPLYSFPIMMDDASEKRFLANHLDPLISLLKSGVRWKTPEKKKYCNMCEYRKVCDDYDMPTVLEAKEEVESLKSDE